LSALIAGLGAKVFAPPLKKTGFLSLKKLNCGSARFTQPFLQTVKGLLPSTNYRKIK
jgi:hypothetical protein